MSSFTIGVDVSKKKFDVCVLNKDSKPKYMSFSNDTQGITDFLAELKSLEVACVICEPTGGYERDLCLQLVHHNYPVHRVHTVKSAAFAKAVGYVKTDKKDAYKLALYGMQFKVTPNYKYAEQQERLRQFVQRREHYVCLLGDAKRQLHTLHDKILKTDMEDHIEELKHRIKKLEEIIKTIINENLELKKRHKCLCTTPGVGSVVAIKLIAFLPELGNKEVKWSELSALVGIAPYTRESGSWNGQGYTRGGRKIPRDALFMAVLTGTDKIPLLQELRNRLLAKGKAKKVALVAAMRKLLGILHSMLRQDRDFVTQMS